MATVHLGIASGSDLANAITGLSAGLENLTAKQRLQMQATRQQASASNQAAAGLASFTQQAQQGVQRIQGVASAVQNLVTQFGSHNRTAGLVASVAGATAQFASMGSMLGPAGTVIGGLAGLVVGLRGVIGEMNDVEDAAREAREEIHNLAAERIAAREEARIGAGIITGAGIGDVSGSDLETRGEEARIRARRAEDEIARLTAELAETVTGSHGITAPAISGPSREVAEEALAAARESLRTENAIVDGVRREVDARADAVAEAERMAELQAAETEAIESEARAYADAAAATAALDDRHRRERARGGGGRRGREDTFDENAFLDSTFAMAEAEAARREAEAIVAAAEEAAAAAERIRAEDAEDFEAWVERRRASMESAMAVSREAAEAERAALADSSDAFAVFSDTGTRSIDQIAAAWRNYNSAAKAAGVQTLSTGQLFVRSFAQTARAIEDSVGDKMTGAFSEAVGAWLDGSKSFVEAAEAMAKGVIKALTQEAIVQTVVELARSVASFASQDYAGGIGHAAAAAAWAAVGVVAGGIGAATGAFGGGGQGAGASSRDTADSQRDRERDQGAGTTVVNIYTDGSMMTRSDAANGFGRAWKSAQRHGAIPRMALRAA